MADGDDVWPLIHANGNGFHKANGHSSPESPTRREREAAIEDRLTSLEDRVATMREEFRETQAGFDAQLALLRNDMRELQASFARMVEHMSELRGRDHPPHPPSPLQ